MASIQLLDMQTEEIQAEIQNKKISPVFWQDIHTQDLEGIETFDFSMLPTLPESEYFSKRNRVIIPTEDGTFREFIIIKTHQSRSAKEVMTVASYTEIKKQKIIDPVTLHGQNANTSLQYIVQGTDWKPGVTELSGTRTLIFEDYINALDALKYLASLFDLELRFRIETKGSRVTGRYVDLLKKQGYDTKKEITLGKDLIDIVRKERTDDVVTGLIGLGPADRNGIKKMVRVEDKKALQRWGRDGRHLWDIYEPVDVDQEITKWDLRMLTTDELEKRVNSVVQYEATAASIEYIFGREHEKVRLGDTNRIKDTSFSPSIYLDARIIKVERSISDPTKKKFTLGEFIEHSEEDIMKTFKSLKKILTQKASSGEVEAIEQYIVDNETEWAKSLYTWIMFADDAQGTNMTPDPMGKEYLGISYNNTTTAHSTNPDDYTWTRVSGSKGTPGEPGEDGRTQYLHIAYAYNATGSDGFSVDDPTDRDYMGTYTDFEQSDSLDNTKYTWAKIKGKDGDPGPQGMPGAPGEDGEPRYIWIRYADDSLGNGMSNIPAGKAYIGIAPNKTQATESLDPNDYTWSRYEGPPGKDGEEGPMGPQGPIGPNIVNSDTQIEANVITTNHLNVSNLSSISAHLGVINSGHINGVTGTFKGKLDSADDISAGHYIYVGANLSEGYNAVVFGNGVSIGALTVNGSTSDRLTIEGGLDVQGDSYLSGDVNMYNNDLDVGYIRTNYDVHVGRRLYVEDDINVNGNLYQHATSYIYAVEYYDVEPQSRYTETGYVGGVMYAPDSGVYDGKEFFGYGVNFKMTKRLTPSSVSLIKASGNSQITASASYITKYGFWFTLTLNYSLSYAGTWTWRGRYSV